MEEKKRILIADPSTALIELILQEKAASDYEIAIADTGPLTLKKIQEFNPQLLIIDLMMPNMHGIEILKKLKSCETTRDIGVIVSTYNIMIQNYHAAIEGGALYFLLKPFEPLELFTLIKRFFKGNLSPDPFSLINCKELKQNYCYEPNSIIDSYIRFWGTRGSSAVSGQEYIRYGGCTSCFEIRDRKDLIIIDAGTGIRKLGETLTAKEEKTIHLFLSHTHWDHVTGFPFFKPLYNKNCKVIIWAPVGFGKSTKEIFTDMLAYAYFPIRLDEMRARVEFRELRDHEPISIGNTSVECHFLNHPGATAGFKIVTPQKTIAYITDNEVLLGYHGHPNHIDLSHPLMAAHLGLIEFLKGCDLIIHEAQYFPKEYYNKIGWGHSSMANATILLKYTGCKDWIITHHDPSHSDSVLQEKALLHQDIIKECNLDIHTEIAYDGLMLPI